MPGVQASYLHDYVLPPDYAAEQQWAGRRAAGVASISGQVERSRLKAYSPSLLDGPHTPLFSGLFRSLTGGNG